MGSNLSCVSCIERERETLNLSGEKQEETGNSKKSVECADVEQHTDCEQSNLSSGSDDGRMPQINLSVNARAETSQQSPAPRTSNNQLQDQINAIVNARAEACKQSPVLGSSDVELKDMINNIVQAHAKSLKQQRADATELASPSPSPAKSLADDDLAYFANDALSAAKERNTPAKSPSPTLAHWEAYEDDFVPCQLSFADDGDSAFEPRKLEQQLNAAGRDPRTIIVKSSSVLPRIVETSAECAGASKVQTCPFDVSDIPSPTRSRAKRQQLFWATSVESEEDHSFGPKLDELAQQTTVESGAQMDLQKLAGKEADQKATKEAARLKEVEEYRRAEEKAMDELCVNTFLEAVKACARRARVRTPIKGTNLYTKHFLPSRPAGTRVNVKESSFRCLSSFLLFLEGEGLLRLKPGLTDPVVTDIHLDACRNYKYVPQDSKPLTSFQ